MTVLIPPTPVDDNTGIHDPHMYNGRVQKLCSLAASTVSTIFNSEISKLLIKDSKFESGEMVIKPAIFDCRVGSYQRREEATSLLLWRSYDCGINGVSDAVYKSKGRIDGAVTVMEESTDQKLIWLARHNLLPLAEHQRAGSYFVKSRKVKNATNRKTGQPTTSFETGPSTRSRKHHPTV